MSYVDGYVLAVPSANRERFRAMAARVAEVFIAHGALRVVENWGDDVPDGKLTDLKRAVQAGPEETVVFSRIEWPSRDARDKGNQAVAIDPRLAQPNSDETDIMDPRRMIYGGFVPVIDVRSKEQPR